jgi:hypothetical protein
MGGANQREEAGASQRSGCAVACCEGCVRRLRSGDTMAITWKRPPTHAKHSRVPAQGWKRPVWHATQPNLCS